MMSDQLIPSYNDASLTAAEISGSLLVTGFSAINVPKTARCVVHVSVAEMSPLRCVVLE